MLLIFQVIGDDVAAQKEFEMLRTFVEEEKQGMVGEIGILENHNCIFTCDFSDLGSCFRCLLASESYRKSDE